jgi:aspartyl-tRNA(Asn)/glutamyl-tRNA(Gln) amidotransferase subunit A
MDGPLTIVDAMPMIRDGRLTPRSLLEQCLTRIDAYEPRVKAWAYLDRDRARREANELTEQLKSGQDRGPLHGIPIGIKDIIDVYDMPTGCGSKLWANSFARRDAEVVAKLRQAGALILGKTVTTPYAFLDPPPTRNPWNLDRTPGGSSSGSAAAVACGMCLAALSSQTGGSTTRPASYCGVCSLKPGWGRISVDGVLPLAPRLDHIGVMTNCVRDLAITFQAVCGPGLHGLISLTTDVHIPDCLTAINRGMDEYWHFIQLNGMFRNNVDTKIWDFYDAACQRIADPSDISESVPPPSFMDIPAAYKAIISTEAAEYHGERWKRHRDDYGLRITELIRSGLQVSAVEYRKARQLQEEVDEELTRILAGSRFFVTPAATSVAPTPETTGDPSFNIPWSFAGAPTVSVPAGEVGGLPFSLQFTGSRNCEDDLFAAAAKAEARLNVPRQLPPVRA